MAFLRNFAKSLGPVKPVTEACEVGGNIRPRVLATVTALQSCQEYNGTN